MKANLVLGCEGYQENGFHFCDKVENIIFDLETAKNTEHYFELIKYLDRVAKVFEGPCNKSYVISNTMYKLFEYGYIDENKHYFLAYFYNMHKRCSLIMDIRLKKGT